MPEDWDPENEELLADAIPSSSRAKDRTRGLRAGGDESRGTGRSALRVAAASAALEDDPRYQGRVVSARAASRKRDAQLPLSDDDDDNDDDGSDGGGGGDVAPEDDEEIGDDEVDGVGSDDDDAVSEAEGSDDDVDGGDDDDDAPELEGVSRIAGLLPRAASGVSRAGRQRGGGGDADRGAGDDDDDDDDDDELLLSGGLRAAAAASAPSSSFLGDLDEQLAALERADASAVARRAADDVDDAARGRAARASIGLYEGCLEARIRLQGSLGAAARLPRARTLAALADAAPPLATRLAGVTASLRTLLGDLLQLRAATLSRLPDVAAAAAAAAAGGGGSRKRQRGDDGGASSGCDAERLLLAPAGLAPLPGAAKRRRRREAEGGDDDSSDDGGDGDDDDVEAGAASAATLGSGALWAAMQAQWAAMAGWRDASLDKWGRKLAFASGLSAKAAGRLKVLASSVPQQVAHALATDRQRLLERSQPLAASVRLLGEVAGAAAAAAPADAAPAAATAANLPGGGSERLADAYDDSDFYTSLLKEFVASFSSSSAAAAAGSAAAHAGGVGKAHPRAVRAGVDRRATKGRRLKYVVQPKLVAFMAPAPYVVPPELAFDLDTLVASLFRS